MTNVVATQIKQKVNQLPTSSGVYLMKDQYGNIIYIGKAKNLKNRVSSYFVNTAKPQKVVNMVHNVFTFDYIITNSELDALNLESNLIKQHQPFYNILLKDGRAHPFIKISTKSQYPKLEIVRKIKRDGNKYFGPYFAGITIKQVLNIIYNAFFLEGEYIQGESNAPYKRMGLNFFLNKLKLPKNTVINQDLYNLEVSKVMAFLNGDLSVAQSILTSKMKLYADMQSYELALECKNSLAVLSSINRQVVTELKNNSNIDVFGYATNNLYSVISLLIVRGGKVVGANNFFVTDGSLSDADTISNFMLQYYPTNSTIQGELVTNFTLDDPLINWLQQNADQKVTFTFAMRGIKKQLLTMANKNAQDYLQNNTDKSKLEWLKTIGAMHSLKEDLHLSDLPVRIECYDISNMQGTNIVASMVVFINGQAYKNHYRKFSIQTVVGKNNDFESMREVLLRRFSHLNDSTDESFKNLPNLIVIDGGKGQLGYAVDVLKELNITTNIVSLAKKQEEVFVPYTQESIYLSRDNNGLKMLQNIRDEAHRFAITFHRQKRAKSSIKSVLLDINGVGEITTKLLIKHYKDITKIKDATITDLTSLGITKPVAARIFDYFEKQV